MRTVTEVARLAGVTVRALHHYDEIGLLRPSDRTDAGYRLYGRDELLRLQEILFYRALGFGLDEIRELIDAPDHDRAAALAHQRGLLLERIAQLHAMVVAVDEALEAERTGTELEEEHMFDVFEGFDPREHEDEAKERWGDTDAYRESARRTSRYGEDDWRAIKEEGDAISRRFAALRDDGVAATDEAAMDVAEEHRQHLSRWFYDCPREMHAALGRMYVDDHRFAESWNRYGDDLAVYVRDAVVANAARS